jgi:adenylate cyclase
MIEMAYLEIIEGPLQGTTVTLDDNITIGRSATNNLSFADNSVSRQHAEIWLKNNYFSLIDLGSANGTFLNNNPLHKHVPRQLYDKDVIVIGSNRFIFHVEGTEPAVTKGHKNDRSSEGPKGKTTQIPALSVVMTTEEHFPNVNATIDASQSFLKSLTQKNPDDLNDSVKRLQAMVKMSIDLGAVFNPEDLSEKIMDGIFDLFPNADRAFVMLRDAKTGELIPVSGRKRTDNDAREDFPISKTIIQTVIKQKQAILSSDAQRDQRFAEKHSVVNLSIRSLMCTPFVCKDEILGVLFVDTISRQRAFNSNDLEMISGIASQAAIALKNAELFQVLEKEVRVRTQLSRYLSKDVVEGIIDGTIPFHLGGMKKKGTILFCDIVGFTSIAEKLSADEVVAKLNRYYSIVTDLVTNNRGTLHKFGGDMLMAFWNVMFPDTTAEINAVNTGLLMQNAVYFFDMILESEGQRPIYLGIGCNTGEFAGGNIGGTDRMEYTVIGDNVNLAQRIESLASRWQVLISSETYIPVKDQCVAIQLPQTQVKGKVQPITVYSIRGILQSDDSLLLNIPIIIMTPDNVVLGNGFATTYRILNDITELHISTPSSIPPWSNLIVQLDLPEFTNAHHLRGRVAASYRSNHDQKIVYTKIILTDLRGTEEARSLFKVGTLINSNKSWVEMRRY